MGGKVAIFPGLGLGFSIIKVKLLFVRIVIEGNIVPARLYCAAVRIFDRIEIDPNVSVRFLCRFFHFILGSVQFYLVAVIRKVIRNKKWILVSQRLKHQAPDLCFSKASLFEK